jgi:hypothetical protein
MPLDFHHVLATGRYVRMPAARIAWFWASAQTDDNGCMVWTKTRSRDGYSSVKVKADGKQSMLQGHRLAWALTNGPIPAGMQLDHLCRNRACINPDHLEPVTSAENTRRAAYVVSPMCRAGKHERTEGNTYITPAGVRACRVCHAEACTRYRNRRRNAVQPAAVA